MSIKFFGEMLFECIKIYELNEETLLTYSEGSLVFGKFVNLAC